MGEKEWQQTDIFDVFGDDLARKILVLASERPLSAAELGAALDASRPTIYRRVNALLDYDLVREHQQIDDDGNHYKTFETTLHRITLEVEDGSYAVDVEMRQNLADQFRDLWSDLGRTSASEPHEHRNETRRSSQRRDTHHG